MLKDLARVILYQPLYNILIFLTFLVPGHSVGVAIIILTVIIRLILIKPSFQAVVMQKKLAVLGPELQKIREQFKGDKSGEAKATLELYRLHKVNPAGSCLPLLIQLPIFLVFYRVVQGGLSTNTYQYLYSFVPRPETLNSHFFGLDLTKPDRWVIPILVGASQFFQNWQLMGRQTKGGPADTSAAISRQMMYTMPLFLVFIARSLPAALGLYWLATTLFSIAQQTLAFRQPATLKTISKTGVEVTVRAKTVE